MKEKRNLYYYNELEIINDKIDNLIQKLFKIEYKEKIKNILINLKELKYICNEEDKKFYQNHILKERLKLQKGHLFILDFTLNNFIHVINNNEIISIIKDIFKIISGELGIKNDD